MSTYSIPTVSHLRGIRKKDIFTSRKEFFEFIQVMFLCGKNWKDKKKEKKKKWRC